MAHVNVRCKVIPLRGLLEIGGFRKSDCPCDLFLGQLLSIAFQALARASVLAVLLSSASLKQDIYMQTTILWNMHLQIRISYFKSTVGSQILTAKLSCLTCNGEWDTVVISWVVI